VIKGSSPKCIEITHILSLEFEKGKNAIQLFSKAALDPTFPYIKKAVDNGELDMLLKEQLAYGTRLTK